MYIVKIKKILYGMAFSLLLVFPAMAEVCFLPDPSACDTGNVSGGGWTTTGSQENCGETFNLSKALEGGVCEQCTDIKSSYYSKYKCTCPSGQQNEGGVCVCINGNKDANGNCVTCSEPKVWNDELQLCECPDSMITENGVCKSCPAEMTPVNNQCECENPDAHKNANGDTCIVCKPEDHKVWDEAQQACVCETEYNMVDGNCVLPGGDCDDPKKTWDSLTKSCVCWNSFKENIDPNTCDCVAGTSEDATTGKCVADNPEVCTPACENENEVWSSSNNKCMACESDAYKEGCACICKDNWATSYEVGEYRVYPNPQGSGYVYNTESPDSTIFVDGGGYESFTAFTGEVDLQKADCGDCPGPRKVENGSCVCDGDNREYNQATNTCDCEAGYEDVNGECKKADDRNITIIVKAECVDEKGVKISCYNVLEGNDIKIYISNLHGLVTKGESMKYNEKDTWTKVITLDDTNFGEKDEDSGRIGSFYMFSYLKKGYITDTSIWPPFDTADDKIEISTHFSITDGMSVASKTMWDETTKTLTVPLLIKKGTFPKTGDDKLNEKYYYAFAIGYCPSPFHPLTSDDNAGKVPCSSIPEHGLAWGSSKTDDFCPIRVIAGSAITLNRVWEYADRFTGCADVTLTFDDIKDPESNKVGASSYTQDEINRQGYAFLTAHGIPLYLKDITNGEKETLEDDETLMVFTIRSTKAKKAASQAASQNKAITARVTVTPKQHYEFYDLTKNYQSYGGYEYAFVDNLNKTMIDAESLTTDYSFTSFREFDINYIGKNNYRYLNHYYQNGTSYTKCVDENTCETKFTDMFSLYPVIRLRYESGTPSSYVSYFRDVDCIQGSCPLKCETGQKSCMKHENNTSPIRYITATRNVLSDIYFKATEPEFSYELKDALQDDLRPEDCEQPCKDELGGLNVKNHMKKGDSYFLLNGGYKISVEVNPWDNDAGRRSGTCSCEYKVNPIYNQGQIEVLDVKSGYLNDRDKAVYILGTGIIGSAE